MPFFEGVLHPERYHGQGRRPPFFEGWYFKLVDAEQRRRIAIIPGIFLNDDPEKRQAFIQVLDGCTGNVTHHRYPVESFHAAGGDFDVRIGRSRFRLDSIELEIDDEHGSWQGELRFEGLHPWPVTWKSPGVMGWYAWVPVMECYHGVLSFDHTVEGALRRGADVWSFRGGRGYIEKDWGESFPEAYVWMQTNHFSSGRASLTGSIAVIPWHRSWFRGFIVGLWLDGILHPFATYTGAQTESLRITDDRVEWVLRSGADVLELGATRAAGGLLLAPNRRELGTRVGETMLASVDVRLDVDGSTRFEGRGMSAGLEVHGDIAPLLV
jgi:tocopherol cyclase